MSFPAIELFGRTHPMVLHLPIGMFVALVALESLMWRRRRPIPPEVRATLLWLATLSAVLTALAGLALSRESSYTAEGVQLHKWLGIAAAAGSLVCLAAGIRRAPGRWYAAALLVTIGLLVPAGHFGAAITHGADFLLEPLHARPAPIKPSKPGVTSRSPAPFPGGPPADLSPEDPAVGPTATPASVNFQRDIAPIFAARCVRCHGAEVQKGELALHTPQSIRAGGQDGPVIDEQDPSKSDMLARIESSETDEGHMPPKGKPQLTPEQRRMLASWILAGAPLFNGSEDTPGSGR